MAPFLETFDARALYGKFTLLEDKKIIDESLVFFVPDKDLQLPKNPIDFQRSIYTEETLDKITILSNAFAKDVLLTSDLPGVRFSDNFFTLEKGENREIIVYSPKDSADIGGNISVRCLNDFIHQ